MDPMQKCHPPRYLHLGSTVLHHSLRGRIPIQDRWYWNVFDLPTFCIFHSTWSGFYSTYAKSIYRHYRCLESLRIYQAATVNCCLSQDRRCRSHFQWVDQTCSIEHHHKITWVGIQSPPHFHRENEFVHSNSDGIHFQIWFVHPWLDMNYELNWRGCTTTNWRLHSLVIVL